MDFGSLEFEKQQHRPIISLLLLVVVVSNTYLNTILLADFPLQSIT